MIKNYLTIAFRTLLKNRTYSLINAIGLSVGTLCCLYILMFVTNQYSYDKHHTKAKNIYRVTSTLIASGEKHQMATCSPIIAPALKSDFPEIEQFTRVIPTIDVGRHLLHYQKKIDIRKRCFFCRFYFFQCFYLSFRLWEPDGGIGRALLGCFTATDGRKTFRGNRSYRKDH